MLHLKEKYKKTTKKNSTFSVISSCEANSCCYINSFCNVAINYITNS